MTCDALLLSLQAYEPRIAVYGASLHNQEPDVAVAVGNWFATLDGESVDGAESASVCEAIGVLEAALDEESELIREHAEWALAQLATD